MNPKRLVLFVEGEGDVTAAPVLIRRILTEMNAWEYVFLDDNVFRVGGVGNLTGRQTAKWINWLGAAGKRKDLGGVLLLLDGDCGSVINEGTMAKEAFCARDVAVRLAANAREAGGGKLFSVACVFACQEYESWLLAGLDSLRGKRFPDGRRGVRADATLPDDDTDLRPRDAKGWLNQAMDRGYKAPTDQEPLSKLVSLNAIRQREPRSFRRLEHALKQLYEAIRTDRHIVSPILRQGARL